MTGVEMVVVLVSSGFGKGKRFGFIDFGDTQIKSWVVRVGGVRTTGDVHFGLALIGPDNGIAGFDN